MCENLYVSTDGHWKFETKSYQWWLFIMKNFMFLAERSGSMWEAGAILIATCPVPCEFQ